LSLSRGGDSVVLLVLCAVLAIVSVASASDATKEETIAFIQEKLSRYGNFSHTSGEPGSPSRESNSSNFIGFEVSQDGTCTYEHGIVKLPKNENSTYVTTSLNSVSLADLDPTSAEVREAGNYGQVYYYWVWFDCRDDAKCATSTRTKVWNGGQPTLDTHSYSFFTLRMSDREQAERVLKAAKHLVEIHGGHGELF
jgi:hypothetical protein